MPTRSNRGQNQNRGNQDSEMQGQGPALSRTRTVGGQQGSAQGTDPRMRPRSMAAQGGQQAGNSNQQGGTQQQQGEQTEAWEEFLDQLSPYFEQVGEAVRVLDRAGWVKVENAATGHKLYFNKGVTGVTRVESSLPPDAVKGAVPPDFYNGRITSIIPPTVEAVGEAIIAIAQVQDRLSPPRRRTRDIAG